MFSNPCFVYLISTRAFVLVDEVKGTARMFSRSSIIGRHKLPCEQRPQGILRTASIGDSSKAYRFKTDLVEPTVKWFGALFVRT